MAKRERNFILKLSVPDCVPVGTNVSFFHPAQPDMIICKGKVVRKK